MSLDALSMLAALAFGIALATERIIVMLKTFIEKLDGKKLKARIAELEKKTPVPESGEAEELASAKWKEWGRRLFMQFLAFGISWIAAAFIAGTDGFDLFGSIPLIADGPEMPAVVLGFIGSGGSAFWKDIVGWTNSVKELKTKAAAA